MMPTGLVVLLVVALATGQASGAAAPGASVHDELSEVRRLINAGEPQQALRRLDAMGAAATEEQRRQTALLRGVAHFHADEPGKAIDVLVAIVDTFGADSVESREARQVLGFALFVTGRVREAVPHLEATRIWAPGNHELAFALGQAYVQLQQPGAARSVLGELYGVESESAAAHLVAAQIMVRLRQESLAEAELRRALEKDPRLPGANILLGQLALFRGRLDDAVTLTRRELAINPANAMSFSQLGDAHVRQAQWDDAAAALHRSLWLNPFYSAPYILLGRVYLKKGDPGAAEGMLRRALQYDPNNRAAHYQLAQLLQQLGRDEEAAREFAIAETLIGTSPP